MRTIQCNLSACTPKEEQILMSNALSQGFDSLVKRKRATKILLGLLGMPGLQ